MSDERLIRDLRALGAAIDWPPTADLVEAVRDDIAALPRRRRWLPLVVSPAGVVTGLLVVLAVVLAASPGARETVADWLRIPGISIGIGDQTPSKAVGDPLPLATEHPLEQARAAVDFPVGVPERLGEPDRVYLDDTFPGGVVTMVWAPRGGLAEIGDDVGALLSVFRADVETQFLEKLVVSVDDVESVDVAGARGVWFGGPAHLLVRDGTGADREVRSRLAAPTLIWERDGVTHRLEADVTRDVATAIAGSVR